MLGFRFYLLHLWLTTHKNIRVVRSASCFRPVFGLNPRFLKTSGASGCDARAPRQLQSNHLVLAFIEVQPGTQWLFCLHIRKNIRMPACMSATMAACKRACTYTRLGRRGLCGTLALFVDLRQRQTYTSSDIRYHTL